MPPMPSLRTTFDDEDPFSPEKIAEAIASLRPADPRAARRRSVFDATSGGVGIDMGVTGPSDTEVMAPVRRFLAENFAPGDPGEQFDPGQQPAPVARVPVKSDPKMKGSAGQEPMVDTPGAVEWGLDASGRPVQTGGGIASMMAPIDPVVAEPAAPRGSIRFSLDGGKTFKEYDPQGGDQVDLGPGRARADSFSPDAASVAVPGNTNMAPGQASGGYGTLPLLTAEARGRETARETAAALPGLAAELEAAHMKTRLEREKPFDAANPPTPTGGEAIEYQQKTAAFQAKQAKEAAETQFVMEGLRALAEAEARFAINPKDPGARDPALHEKNQRDVLIALSAMRNNPGFIPKDPNSFQIPALPGPQ